MTAAKVRSLAIGVIALSAAALSAGCNLEPSAADKPTYEADVRPIFMSRCIRCHGSPALNDPAASPPSGPASHQHTLRRLTRDSPNCSTDGGAAACVHGAAHEAMNKRFTSVLVMLKGKFGYMPPSPAPALTSYQNDTILKWESEAANGGTPLE